MSHRSAVFALSLSALLMMWGAWTVASAQTAAPAVTQQNPQAKRATPKAPAKNQSAKNQSVRTITPVFSQLLMVGSPRGFQPVFEKAGDNFYIRESVPKGETVDHWKQIITVTGIKGLAAQPGANPKTVINNMAEGYKRACPASFSSQGLSEGQIEGFDAVIAVLACGISAGNIKTSESAMIVVIKGTADFYTVQWAERAAPATVPLPIDVKKWTARFQELAPIRLCPIIPGEAAPYPSCVGPAAKPPG